MAIVVLPAADDYTPLLSRVADWMFRPDLTAKIPTFISLAEGAIFRELRLRQTEIILSGSTSSATISLPAGTRSIERLAITADGVQHTLDYTTPNGIEPLTYSTGRPTRYTVENQAIRLLTAPGSAYDFALHYIPNLLPITADNPSNWLSVNAPDLYLYGALLQAASFTMDDAHVARYGPHYAKAIDSVRRVDEALRLPISGGLQIKPRNAR